MTTTSQNPERFVTYVFPERNGAEHRLCGKTLLVEFLKKTKPDDYLSRHSIIHDDIRGTKVECFHSLMSNGKGERRRENQ